MYCVLYSECPLRVVYADCSIHLLVFVFGVCQFNVACLVAIIFTCVMSITFLKL